MKKKWESSQQQQNQHQRFEYRRQRTDNESTPINQYNLKSFERRNNNSQASQQQTKRSLTAKKIKADSLLFEKMNEKLESIQSRIEQMKANIHKKKLDRMKKNVLRSQQLQQLKKKFQIKQFLSNDSSKGKDDKMRSQKKVIQVRKESESEKSEDQYQVKKRFLRKKPSIKSIPQNMNNNVATLQNQFQTKNKQQKKEKQQQKGVNEKSLSDLITQQKVTAFDVSEKTSQEKLKMLVTAVPQSQSHSFDTNPYSPRSNTYYVSEVIKGFRDKTSVVYEHLRISIQLFNIFSQIRMPNNSDVKKRCLNLPINPKYEGKKTVIFDLDQTLIHCNVSLKMEHQIQLPIKFPTGEIIKAGINIRPGATQILQALYQNFQLIVFTASQQCYANVVIDYLDPKKQYIQHRLYREHCYITSNGMYVKDLRIINRDMKNMVLVDNAAYSYAFQPQNGIPIIPYYHGDKDFELRKLLFCNDVRKINRETFRLTRYRDYKNNEVDKLVQNLYINKIQ